MDLDCIAGSGGSDGGQQGTARAAPIVIECDYKRNAISTPERVVELVYLARFVASVREVREAYVVLRNVVDSRQSEELRDAILDAHLRLSGANKKR